MDWNKSYSASWRFFRVNRDTWADGEQVYGIDSVDVTRTANGELLESGSMEVTGSIEPDYYRAVMTAEQAGEVVRVDVATLLFDVTGGERDHGVEVRNMEGFSVLYPASVTSIITGEYAPANVDGAQYAGKLLAGAINAPVEVEGSFILNQHVVHEFGSSVLEAVWDVLNAGNFIIQIDGRGVVHIKPKPKDPVLILGSNNMRTLLNGVSYSTDISKIPNRYVVITENNRTVAINNDPTSSVSVVSRGYCVDEVDESPEPINGETLPEYARRKLLEMSVVKEEKNYTREYAPNVDLYCIVRGSIRGLEGDMRIESQTLECGTGITVSEKAVREVSVWQGT